jgi:acetyltransferase-like isoleucine patch superfamily enzyme
MSTEYEKMLNQEWYDANNDTDLLALRSKVQDACFEYNQTRPSDLAKREALLAQILGEVPENVEIVPPLWVDYGRHIKLGKNVFVNKDAYFMDGNRITIGDQAFIGPNCGFYTNTHPENIERRNQGLEKARPITIEKNTWIGANVTVLPGVTIGEGSVIGAGSVVTKDIPKNSLAVGSPCRVLRPIDPEQ